MCPLPRREAAWARLARDLDRDTLKGVTHTAPLSDLPALAEEILAGRIQGRTVIEVAQR
jgi:acrylyl-CoA reductase (NADPH)